MNLHVQNAGTVIPSVGILRQAIELISQLSNRSSLIFLTFLPRGYSLRQFVQYLIASLTHQGIMAAGMESGGQPVIPEALAGGPPGVLDPASPIIAAPSSSAQAPTSAGGPGGTGGGQRQFMGVKRKDLDNIVTFVDALKLCGFVEGQEDLVVQGIHTALEADYDLSYSVFDFVLEEEFEATVVQTLKQRRLEVTTEGRPAVVESPAGIIWKVRVRKAYKLCFEVANGKPTTESSGLNDLQAQMAALAAAVAQGVMMQSTPAPATPPKPKEEPSTVVGRKLKLKELVDQVSEEECDALTDEQWLAAYARYEATMGKDDKPPEEEEPTLEQLLAVSYLIKSGVYPYVDFGVFGPHGQRMMKKIKLQCHVWNNDNPPQLVKVEIKGPATHSIWRASYIV